MQQVLVLGLVLADLLQLLAGRPLGRYLDDAPLQCGLGRLALLLIGKIKEVVLHEKVALEFRLQLHLSLAVLIRIPSVFLFFSIPFDHFQHIISRDLLGNRAIALGRLDLHGLAGLGRVLFSWEDDILCGIFFSLLILAEIGQRRHLHVQGVLLSLAAEPAEVGLRHPDCLLQLRRLLVVGCEEWIEGEVGCQLRRMEKGAA